MNQIPTFSNCHPALVVGSGDTTTNGVFTTTARNKYGVTKLLYILFAIIVSFLLSLPAHAENNVQASLVSEATSISAGQNIKISVLLNAPNDWHTYYKTPGDAGLPTQLKWVLPEGFSASEIDWPEPTKFDEEGLTVYGYTGETLLPTTITIPDKLNATSYSFTVEAKWLACKQICIPESQTLTIELPVNATASALNSQNKTENIPNQTSDISPLTLLVTLAFALVGGLILNIMPCVLPILSLKTLALVKKSGKTRSHTAKYGIAYTLGILFSFAFIAGLLISLQQGGQAIGWGFQMQSPTFVGFLIYLLFLVGLNLSGAFYLPVILGGVGNNINENTVSGSFFTGVLASLVATPCTAPFMASAVGAALTLPAWAAMLVFLSLGLGLAMPFLLISIFPSLLRFLPKQGAWMEKFKEFLAFPMYCAVIWLLWVLGKQVGMDGVALVLCGLLLIMLIIWLQHAVKNCNIFYRIFTVFSVGIMLAAILFSLNKNEQEKTDYIPYSKATLSQLRSEGKAVYVDATAAWCITCQLNKRSSLDTARTKQAFKDHNVTLMVADWTNQNPEITDFLRGFGYNGVPLNVFYPANGSEPVILPQILSEQVVIETISK